MIEEDHCVYTKRSDKGFLILSLYVDDILLAGNDMELINATRAWLSSNFEMKDMGNASYVLGIQILRDRSKRILGLSQETYLRKILEHYRMENCTPISTPVMKGHALSQEQCPHTPEEKKRMSTIPYASVVGSLMYAMMCTRPDISFAVGLVSRYQSNPGPAHWQAVKRILRYIRGTYHYVLCFGGSDLYLKGYTDADWAGDLDERASTSAYVFLLGGGAISWCSKKQKCISLSTMEAEYVAASAAAQEAVWLRRFLKHLQITDRATEPVTLFSDSMSAIAFSKDPKYHGRTKHIAIRHHFIRKLKKKVALEYIPTERMIADPLTKGITEERFKVHTSSLGLRPW